jgi:hypothetical protein
MTVNRGEVALVDYPFTTGGAKVGPALVVQNDRDNVRMTNAIDAQISGNTARVNEATHGFLKRLSNPRRENQPRLASSMMAVLTEGVRRCQFATSSRSAASSQTECRQGDEQLAQLSCSEITCGK